MKAQERTYSLPLTILARPCHSDFLESVAEVRPSNLLEEPVFCEEYGERGSILLKLGENVVVPFSLAPPPAWTAWTLPADWRSRCIIFEHGVIKETIIRRE